MTDIWARCKGSQQIQALKTRAYRIVESQEQIATMSLVDSLEEQQLLEQLLDETKPGYVSGSQKYHYLIATPFRYPPLHHGSRFGQRYQRGIFYGSLELKTVFAECAYYRFIFWHGMDVPPPSSTINSQHTSFSVSISSDRCIRLELPPFAEYVNDISSPVSYQSSQLLGSNMREHNIQAFTYVCARSKEKRINLGVFDIAAINKKQPDNMQHWNCVLNENTATFMSTFNRKEMYDFYLSDFMVDGRLPQPACE